jgi:hypothetical protein
LLLLHGQQANEREHSQQARDVLIEVTDISRSKSSRRKYTTAHVTTVTTSPRHRPPNQPTSQQSNTATPPPHSNKSNQHLTTHHLASPHTYNNAVIFEYSVPLYSQLAKVYFDPRACRTSLWLAFWDKLTWEAIIRGLAQRCRSSVSCWNTTSISSTRSTRPRSHWGGAVR